MSEVTSTFKLGQIYPQDPLPGSSTTPFTMDWRYPGWHPDAGDNGSGGRKELLIEEAIGRADTGAFVPFGVPQYGGVDFDEPTTGTATAADWNTFNKWILGGPIPDAPGANGTEPPMTTLVRELAVWVRKYNASLYRLRRLHFYAYHWSEGLPLPPKNPHGDPDLPPNGTTLEALVAAAEDNWKSVVIPGINTFVDQDTVHVYPNGTLRIIAADMVEVNGYVISARVVAVDAPTDGLKEIGGSSSSHVSVSSTFSSSSP